MSEVELLARARRVRQRYRDGGQAYTTEQVFEATLTECSELAETALRAAVRGACKQVDKDATRPTRKSGQRELFDLDGDYALGESERVGRAHAKLEQILRALALSDDNLRNVQEANEAFHREIDLLMPYLERGMSKREAAESWLADNPDADVA